MNIKININLSQHEKRTPIGVLFSWCEKRDLNPYGVTTRPSNVRVCQFRHSRVFKVLLVDNVDIILQNISFVNRFLKKNQKKFLSFFAWFLVGDFGELFAIKKPNFGQFAFNSLTIFNMNVIMFICVFDVACGIGEFFPYQRRKK